MKKVIRKTWPAHIFGGRLASPEKRAIRVKMEFDVTMGLYRKGACLIK